MSQGHYYRTMHYLYHMVPKDLVGDILYPLNKLKLLDPELYDKKTKKYQGREYQLELKVPPLNCLWNDVLHLSPIHPQEVVDTLKACGDTGPYTHRCYQIDPYFLDKELTTVFLYSKPKERRPRFEVPADDFIDYDPNKIEQYAHYSQLTKDYFCRMYADGKYPLLYHFVPHILYKGTINVSNLPIIEASIPAS
ncbi:MAG TPA: hypothetical protein VGE59_03940 [Patescibacteria group bacterium]